MAGPCVGHEIFRAISLKRYNILYKQGKLNNNADLLSSVEIHTRYPRNINGNWRPYATEPPQSRDNDGNAP